MKTINLECNRCGKRIGSLCGTGFPSLDCKKIKTIERNSYDPFFMEIVCDECAEGIADRENEGMLTI